MNGAVLYSRRSLTTFPGGADSQDLRGAPRRIRSSQSDQTRRRPAIKGKYANRAQKHREVAAAEEDAANAKRAQISAEVALKEYSTSAEDKIARLEERLSDALAQRDSAAAPRIAELERQAETLSQQASDATVEAEAIRKTQTELVNFTARLLHNLTGCTGLEATEHITAAIKGLPEVIIIDPKSGIAGNARQHLSTDENKTLQRVRGWRSSPKVIEHLDRLVASAKGKGE